MNEREQLLELIDKKGADAFAIWKKRDDFSLIRFPLARANLRGLDLSEVNLEGAILYMADLTGAKLVGARLYYADLYGATLEKADLRSADLRHCKFLQANLRRADLRHTSLDFADMEKACLREADLTGANLRGTRLIAAGLQKAILHAAQLELADLRYADVTDADFQDAALVTIQCGRIKWADKEPLTLWRQLERAKKREDVHITLPTLKDMPGLRYDPGPGSLEPYKKVLPRKRPF